MLVVDEEIIVRAAVVGRMLCFLCVYLNAVLQLCVRPLDGGELHVTYCGPGFQGMVGDDPVKPEWLEQTYIMWTVHLTRSAAGFTSLYLMNYIFALDLVHTIGDRTESR